MNKEEINNWYFRDLGSLGAYIIETNGECSKQVDVNHIKKYIKDLLHKIEQTQQKVNQLETNRDEAIEYLNSYYAIYKNATDGFNYGFDSKKAILILERGKE